MKHRSVLLGAALAAAILALPTLSLANEAACEHGVALVNSGDATTTEAALQSFDVCLSSDSIVGDGRARMHVFRGSLRLQSDRAPEAQQDFEAAIALRSAPSVYDYHYLAAAYAKAGQYDKAYATLNRARDVVMKLDPRRHRALLEQLESIRGNYQAQAANEGKSGSQSSPAR